MYSKIPFYSKITLHKFKQNTKHFVNFFIDLKFSKLIIKQLKIYPLKINPIFLLFFTNFAKTYKNFSIKEI